MLSAIHYARAPEHTLWPSLSQWNGILRAASAQAGLDARHTLLCHLARKASAHHRLERGDARKVVRSRIANHAGALATEFGFEPQYATAIAERVYAWLESLQEEFVPSIAPVWPTASEWLAIDRGAAWRIGLDGQFTLSTNLASLVAPARRMTPLAAKRWVHKRIASHAAQLARECGVGFVAGVVISARITVWLNSFDA